MEFHGVARTEENHDLLLLIFPQKSVQESEPLIPGADHEPLLQSSHSADVFVIVHSDIDWVLQRQPCKVLNLFCLSGTEQYCLSIGWD